MDNQDFNIEDLKALVAATYSGGNSWAARSARARAQRRDDKGQFAFMFGAMRMVMLLNGIPVAAFSNYVGASTRGDNMGWFYVNPGDPSVKAGFYRYPVDKASTMGDKDSRAQAILGDDYLASKGIDRKNPNTYGDYPDINELEYQEAPPGFVNHPSVGGAFISEDGDVTIEPDGEGGWLIDDNIDRSAPQRTAADMVEALKQVAEIDKTRSNYEPEEGEAPTTPAEPVAEIAPEADKDPASMSNSEIEAELARLDRVGGVGRGLKGDLKARQDALYDEMDLRSEDEESLADPDFVRTPEAGTPAETPVAELPSGAQAERADWDMLTNHFDPNEATPLIEEEIGRSLTDGEKNAVRQMGLPLSAIAPEQAPTEDDFKSLERDMDKIGTPWSAIEAKLKTRYVELPETPSADAITPEQQKSLDDFAKELAGMSNADVLDEMYEARNAFERADVAETEPSAFLEASSDLVAAEYKKRMEALEQNAPDPNNYFRDGNIARGYHNYDNNTRFYYSEDVVGNITYGMENYTPDGGLANEDVREAKTVEEARKNVIAMIDAYGKDGSPESAKAVPSKKMEDYTDEEIEELARQERDYNNRPRTDGMIGRNVSYRYQEELQKRGLSLFIPSTLEDSGDKAKPSSSKKNPLGLEGDVTFRDADGNRISRNDLWNLPVGTEIDAQQLLPGNRMGKANFVREEAGWKNTATGEVFTQDGKVEQSKVDKQISEIQAESIAGEGTTYSILGADAPTDGYMVSHEAIVDPVDKDVFEGEGGKQALFDFIKKAQELGFFQSDNEFVGVWLDTETNKYYLDVSENVKDLDEAKRLGAERNQIAIWDIANGEAINVGGTGEREETDSGAEPDGQDGSRDSGSGEPPVGGPAGEVAPEEPESNVTSPEQLLEDKHIDRLDELVGMPDNSYEDGNVYYGSSTVDAYDGEEGGVRWFISYIDENGVEHDYVGFIRYGDSTSVYGDLRSQIEYEKSRAERQAEQAPVVEITAPEESGEPNAPIDAKSVSDAMSTQLPTKDMTDLYLEAVQNGRDSVSVDLTNYGAPEELGPQKFDIPIDEFRQNMVDAGIDVDSLDNGFQSNEDTKQEIADDLGSSVEDLSPAPRTDWRNVIRSNDEAFRDVFFWKKDGQPGRYERRDNKWFSMTELGPGISAESLIRKIDRLIDPNHPDMEIDDGEPLDELSDYDFYDANNRFTYGGPEGEFVEGAPARPVIERMMHVVGGDTSQVEAEEKAGRPVDIMDAVRERFPDAVEGEDGELITDVREWTAEDGTKYRYEVVIVRTADEYFYTYIRQTNLTENVAWSARLGVISQSATALFNAYDTNVGTFMMSFFRPGGPRKWMEGNARKASRRRDVWDEEAKKWVHVKEIKNNQQTRANLKRLLGIEPASDKDIRKAEDAFFQDILDGVIKWRMNDRKLQIFANNKGVSLDYLYRVIGAYDAHLANQANIDGYGTWVSFDQQTPLDAGDIVEHVSGRKGVVRKRLGWVDSLGRYRYTDYVEVRWEDGRISWTTSRNNKLIRTADGTDGSERIMTKGTAPTDPRGESGAETPVTQSDPLPANPQKQTRVQATRNENSELVLPDGTVVPERIVGGTQTSNAKQVANLKVGDFVGVLNDDGDYVTAPVVGTPELNEDGSAYNVDIAVRENDGTYSVNTFSFSSSDRQTVLASTPVNNDTENAITIAQFNELLELMVSKQDTASVMTGNNTAFFYAVIDGTYDPSMMSSAELADILRAMRNLPDREPTPVQDLADFARRASEDAVRSNNQEAADTFAELADAGDIIASQSRSSETPNEVAPEAPSAPEGETPNAPEASETPEETPLSLEERHAKVQEFVDRYYDAFSELRAYTTGTFRDEIQNALVDLFDEGPITGISSSEYVNFINNIDSFNAYMAYMQRNLGDIQAVDPFGDEKDAEQMEIAVRFLGVSADVVMNSIPNVLEGKGGPLVQEAIQGMRDVRGKSELSDFSPVADYRAQIESLNTVIDDTYDGQLSPRQAKAYEMMQNFAAGYYVDTEADDEDLDAPENSINSVSFITLNNGQRAVLKVLDSGANSPEDEIKAELTSYRMFEQLGAPSLPIFATVLADGRPALVVEMFEGVTAGRHNGRSRAEIIDNTPGAEYIGLMDLIGGNPDRHSGNWMISENNDSIMPIDNGHMYMSITDSDFRGEMQPVTMDILNRRLDYANRYASAYPFAYSVARYALFGERDTITDDTVRTFAERLTSLREMYASMGMEYIYEQMLKSTNLLLGIASL